MSICAASSLRRPADCFWLLVVFYISIHGGLAGRISIIEIQNLCGSAATNTTGGADMTVDAPPQRFSNFLNERFSVNKDAPLGSGGFGIVYDAQVKEAAVEEVGPDGKEKELQHVAAGDHVALKVLAKAGQWRTPEDDKNKSEALVQECQQMQDWMSEAGEGREHLAHCLGSHKAPEQPVYIVMELAGYDGGAWLNAHKTNKAQVLNALAQVAEGLVYLSQRPTPLIHHDLKWQNVAISDGPSVKIIDFGAMMQATEANQHLLGTSSRAFAPPEKIKTWKDNGEGKRKGEWTQFDLESPWSYDVFSLGVMALEGLCELEVTSGFFAESPWDAFRQRSSNNRVCDTCFGVGSIQVSLVPRGFLGLGTLLQRSPEHVWVSSINEEYRQTMFVDGGQDDLFRFQVQPGSDPAGVDLAAGAWYVRQRRNDGNQPVQQAIHNLQLSKPGSVYLFLYETPTVLPPEAEGWRSIAVSEFRALPQGKNPAYSEVIAVFTKRVDYPEAAIVEIHGSDLSSTTPLLFVQLDLQVPVTSQFSFRSFETLLTNTPCQRLTEANKITLLSFVAEIPSERPRPEEAQETFSSWAADSHLL